MKKIIQGKIYDTAKAREVGCHSNGYYPNDFHYSCQSLFRKRTGEYFIFGEGGALTRYAERVDSNSWTGGWAISPVSYDEARQWAEENLTADEYEAEFGEVIEDDTRTTLTISLPTAVLENARRAAAAQGVSLSAYIIGKFN